MPTTSVRILAFLSSGAIALGAWLSWIDGVSAIDMPMRRLIGEQMHRQTTSFLASVGVLLVVAAIIGLFGVLLPSPTSAFVGALLAIVTTALLLIQEFRTLPDHQLANLVGPGVWTTGVAAVVLLLVSFALKRDSSG